MLPSPSPRLVLENRTNLLQSRPLSTQLPTPPADRKFKRHSATIHDGAKKRPRIELEEKDSEDLYESNDSDVDMEDVAAVHARSKKSILFQRNIVSAMRHPGKFRQLDSTYFRLQMFFACSLLYFLNSVYSSNTTIVRFVE